VIHEDGAPRGRKDIIVWDPPLLESHERKQRFVAAAEIYWPSFSFLKEKKKKK